MPNSDELSAAVMQAALDVVAAFGAHDTERYFAGFAPEATFLFHAEPEILPSRAAYEAASEHAVRLVVDVPVAVVGGDAVAVAAVLEDPRLQHVRDGVVGAFLTVPDPRRSVLEAACAEAQSFTIEVVNA